MSARRLLPLVLLNVIVSAAVVLGILYWWENRSDAEPEPEAVVIAPTAAATQAAQPAQPAVLEEEAEPAEEAPTREKRMPARALRYCPNRVQVHRRWI